MRYAFGFGSGAGAIFGVTGGVTEAMLRRLADDHNKATMDAIAEAGARGDEGIKEFTVNYKGTDLNVCVASGLANAQTVMEDVKSGRKHYHIIEIMHAAEDVSWAADSLQEPVTVPNQPAVTDCIRQTM